MRNFIIPLFTGSLVAAGVIIAASIVLGYGELSFYFGAIYAVLYFFVLMLAHVIASKIQAFQRSYLVYGALGFFLPVVAFLSVFFLSGTSAGLIDGIFGYGLAGCLGALSLHAIAKESV